MELSFPSRKDGFAGTIALSTCLLEAFPSKSTAIIINENHVVNDLRHGSHVSGMDAETIKT